MDTVLSMREQRRFFLLPFPLFPLSPFPLFPFSPPHKCGLFRGMVQTKEQYCFIYRVAEDALNALLKKFDFFFCFSSFFLLLFPFLFFFFIAFTNLFLDSSPLLGESWRSEGLAAAEFLKVLVFFFEKVLFFLILFCAN